MATPSITEISKARRVAGNSFFQRKNYPKAKQCYTESLQINPMDVQSYTNRALCNFRMDEFELVIQDCKRAMEFDPTNVKAYFYAGVASRALKQYDEALSLLAGASRLAKSQNVNVGDILARTIRETSREKFHFQEHQRSEELIDLQGYLNELMENDVKTRIQNLELPEGEEKNLAVKNIHSAVQKHRNALARLLAEHDEAVNQRSIPDYLCGKISLEILRDPVITPSGITYDRSDIVQHLTRVGHFDPVTREHLTENQLIPNRALREVVDDFLAKNEWANHVD